MMLTHAELLCQSFGENLGIRQFRKHAGWYLTGFAVGPAVRRALGQAGTPDEVIGLLGGLDRPSRSLPRRGGWPADTPTGRSRSGSRPGGWTRWTTPLPPSGGDVLVSGG